MKHWKRAAACLLLGLMLLGLCVYAEEPPVAPPLRRADETKAVVLLPGRDFDPAAQEADCKKQIDKAMEWAANLDMNTVFLPVNTEKGSLFAGEQWPSAAGFDLLRYVMDSAKEQSIFVYAVVDARYGMGGGEGYGRVPGLSAAAVQELSRVVAALADDYDPDGVYLANFCNEKDVHSMSRYRAEGSAMGYENWLRECVTSLVVNTSRAVKDGHPDTVFGLVTEPVWANRSTDPAGSETAAEYEMLTDGFADLNGALILGQVDDLLVCCPGSLSDEATDFETVIQWWSGFANQHGATALIYNQNLGAKLRGWAAPDQVMRQVIKTRETENCKGAAFASLPALTDNYSGSTDVLMRYYRNEIREQDILTNLTVSKPAKRTYTTREPQVIFYGASDPNFPLTVNGWKLGRNSQGVFSAEYELKPGLNSFVFEHKGRKITYNITREVVIIDSVSPAPGKNITVEGGTQVGVTVMAYSGSKVTASLAGQYITLKEQELTTDSADGNTSSYVPYKGSFTMPAGTGNVQDIGNIGVTASWQGIDQNGGGAHISVAALPKKAPQVEGQKGTLAEVTASQARTYPAGVLTNDPYGNCFPLPQGTVDYIVSDRLTYDDDYGHGEYYILASGLRVRAGDVTGLGEAEWELSSLSGASSWADDQYVYVAFDRTGRKTAYTVEFPGVAYSGNGNTRDFAAGQLRVTLKDTQINTEAPRLADNNLLSGVELAQSGNDAILNFNLRKAGSFLGYRAYYDGDRLVFRFNQIPGGIAGAKIYIDPGHGGNDGGTSIPGMYSEKSVNADLAARTAQVLRDRGAIVQVTDTAGTVSLNQRIELSQNFGPHLFVSIHHNAGVSSARGSEVYYFNPYSQGLANRLSYNLAAALQTKNRGDKHGAYRVTTHMEFPAVLIEGGFLTNPEELSKLQNDTYKNAMAVGIADAIQATLESMR